MQPRTGSASLSGSTAGEPATSTARSAISCATRVLKSFDLLKAMEPFISSDTGLWLSLCVARQKPFNHLITAGVAGPMTRLRLLILMSDR